MVVCVFYGSVLKAIPLAKGSLRAKGFLRGKEKKTFHILDGKIKI